MRDVNSIDWMCPDCRSVFRIAAQMAAGRVRCPACHHFGRSALIPAGTMVADPDESQAGNRVDPSLVRAPTCDASSGVPAPPKPNVPETL